MISSRRAALLGIGFPLSPIMIAVLGLWPGDDDDDDDGPLLFGLHDPLGGGRKMPRSNARHSQPKRKDEDHDARIERQNRVVLAVVMAAMTEELI